jgi:RNA polymerase sigma factor (sigma-70 family)
VAELARRYDRSPSAIYHIIRLARARKLLARRIHYVHSPLFESRSADQEILGLNVVREPGLAESAAVARSKDGEGTSSPSIYGPPPLRKDEERQLFLRYNYLKFKAAQWQARLAGAYPSQRIMDGLDGLLRDAEQVRERLVRSYLRLVVAVACRHLGKRVVLNDLVSEGNLCLLRAVEKFDAARGNRFSTYLTWALIKTYARTIPEANFESANFLTGQEERLAAAGAPNDARDGPDDDEARKHFIGDMLSSLTDREREVIASRFGLGAGQGASYGEIGKKLGVTKERARQIHGAAMRKLRAQLTPSEKK